MAKISLNSVAGILSKSLGDYSVYTQRGVQGAIIRAKGGPSAKTIKTDPGFAPLRLHQTEFAGVGKLNGYLAQACKGVKHLADYNFCGQFSRMTKLLQNLDTDSSVGQRSIVFTKASTLFNGFNLNRETPFSSVVISPLAAEFRRNEVKAIVDFPELNPTVTLKDPWNLPLFRFVLALGNIPDMVYGKKGYRPASTLMNYANASMFSTWYSSKTKMFPFRMEIQLSNDVFLDDTGSLLLSVGIEFGIPVSGAMVAPVKHAGCARILGVG